MKSPLNLFLMISLLSFSTLGLGGGVGAPSSEGQHSDSVSLNGAWEFVLGDGDERAETLEGASRLHWQATTLPGAFMPWDAGSPGTPALRG